LGQAEGIVQAHGIYNPEPAGGAAYGLDQLYQPFDKLDSPDRVEVEIRKEGKIGRVYYPAPYMTNDNLEYYEDAYEIGYEKVIDTYAAATQARGPGSVADTLLQGHATNPRREQGADLRLAQGNQDAVLHPLRPDGVGGNRSGGLCVVIREPTASRRVANKPTQPFHFCSLQRHLA